jgi:hypothetical protein
MSSLSEAVRYLGLGWSVIPIQKYSKRPLRQWKEFQDRRMSLQEAINAFTDDTNIGLVCGDISGILVIDDDSYKKKAGEDAMELNTPLFATTPRGGKHFYFRYKEGGNTVNQELAVDIRSQGGYVLIPPSLVRYENGSEGTYKWNQEPSKELLDTLPFAPESLLRQVYGQTGVQTQGVAFSSNLEPFKGGFTGSSSLYIKEGGRNAALSKLALSLLNKYDKVTAWGLLEGANMTFSPPLEQMEVISVFTSALKKFQASPPIGKSDQKKGGLREELAENAQFKLTSFKEDIELAKKIYLEGKVTGIPTGFQGLDDLVGGYIPGQSYLVYADTSVGKSIFAINSLVALAKAGTQSLYFDLENSMELTVERLAFVASGGELSLAAWRRLQAGKDEVGITEVLQKVAALPLEVWDLNKLTERFGDIVWDGVKKCVEEGVEKGAKVVVIDHLHYFSPSETDHSFLGDVMRQVNNLCAVHGISILVVAHTKKGLIEVSKSGKVKVTRPTIDHISGSGLIAKHCKNIISLQRNVASDEPEEREQTIIYVDKTKFGPTGSFRLRFGEKFLCFFDDGKAQMDQKEDSFWEDLGKDQKEFSKKREEQSKKDDLDELVDDLVASKKW